MCADDEIGCGRFSVVHGEENDRRPGIFSDRLAGDSGDPRRFVYRSDRQDKSVRRQPKSAVQDRYSNHGAAELIGGREDVDRAVAPTAGKGDVLIWNEGGIGGTASNRQADSRRLVIPHGEGNGPCGNLLKNGSVADRGNSRSGVGGGSKEDGKSSGDGG